MPLHKWVHNEVIQLKLNGAMSKGCNPKIKGALEYINRVKSGHFIQLFNHQILHFFPSFHIFQHSTFFLPSKFLYTVTNSTKIVYKLLIGLLHFKGIWGFLSLVHNTNNKQSFIVSKRHVC